MFSNAYATIRESTYFLLGRSASQAVSCGTAFMFARGVLAAAAHVLYKDKGDSSSFQDRIQVMRDPEINGDQRMERATVIAVEAEYDIALLRIENPRSETCATFTMDMLGPGTVVGSLGYALVDTEGILARAAVPLLRFQGGYISAVYAKGKPAVARHLWYYETDVPMYKGSSGGPGFLADGKIFGMHVAEWHEGGTEESPGQRAFSMWIPASAIISFAQDNNVAVQSSSP